jgi:DNA-directed RNA polymerase sigma subunit (sigma70/sigma32)
MTKEEVIKLIKEYKNIMPEIRSLNEQLNDYLGATVKAVTITDIPKSVTNNISDPVGDLVARYNEDIEYLANEIKELLDKKKSIEEMLSKLDYIETQVIKYRYITNPNRKISDIYDWVGDQLNYSRRQVIRIHNIAIEKMALNGTKYMR